MKSILESIPVNTIWQSPGKETLKMAFIQLWLIVPELPLNLSAKKGVL